MGQQQGSHLGTGQDQALRGGCGTDIAQQPPAQINYDVHLAPRGVSKQVCSRGGMEGASCCTREASSCTPLCTPSCTLYPSLSAPGGRIKKK